MQQERGFFDAMGRFVPEQGAAFESLLRDVGGPLAENRLVLRTEITPDVSVDLTSLASPKPPQPKGLVGHAIDWIMSELIRPEVEVAIAGQRRSIAPWGAPTGSGRGVAAVTAGAVLLGAAYFGYRLARRR